MSAASVAGRPIRLGVSSCLLGQAVRYDAGHKRDRFATEVLGGHVECRTRGSCCSATTRDP